MQRILSVLLLVTLAAWQTAAYCEPGTFVGPCLCLEDENMGVELHCSNVTDGSQISDVLIEIGAANVELIAISDSPALASLPDDVFGVTFVKHLSIENTGLRSLSPEVFGSATAEVLLSLYIKRCPAYMALDSDMVGVLSKLEELYVSWTGVTDLSVPLPYTRLQYLDLTHNNISEIVGDYFAEATRLRIVLLGFNSLTSCCATQTFAHPDGDLYLDFGYNSLTEGLKRITFSDAPPRELILSGNAMTYINETNFAPLMKEMALHYNNTYILLDNNPLECGCELSWLLTNPYREILRSARCTNGQLVANLGPDDFAACP